MKVLLFAFVSISGAWAISNSSFIEVDYFDSTNITLYDDHCDLSFQLLIETQQQTTHHHLLSNSNHYKSLLFWAHSHIYDLIDTSFVYDIDKYTDDLWIEYYLKFISITNDTQNAMLFTINICSSQLEIQDIITQEVTNDGDEIAAFIRHQLSQNITDTQITVTLSIISTISTTKTLSIAADNTTSSNIITSTEYKTTTTAITPILSSSDDTHLIYTQQMIYIVIMGVVVIILALIIIIISVCCIKQKTDKRLQTAINDMKSYHEKRGRLQIPSSASRDTDDVQSVISIDPIGIPKMSPHRLMTIDHGLNVSDDETASIKIQRNTLALMPTDNNMVLTSPSSFSLDESKSSYMAKKRAYKEPELSNIDELRGPISLNIDDLVSDQGSSYENNVFIDTILQHSHSQSAHIGNKVKKNKNDDRNILYHNIPIAGSKSMILPNRQNSKKLSPKKLFPVHSLKQISDERTFDDEEKNELIIPTHRKSVHSPQIRKYRNKLPEKQKRHSSIICRNNHNNNTIQRQQYAKRKLEKQISQKSQQVRSQSKPNLRLKKPINSNKSNSSNISGKPSLFKHESHDQPNLGRRRNKQKHHGSLPCLLSSFQPGNSANSSISSISSKYSSQNSLQSQTFSYHGNHSNSMRNLNQFVAKSPSKKSRRHRKKKENKSLNVHCNANVINSFNKELQRKISPESMPNQIGWHQLSVDVDAIKFDSNGMMNIDVNEIETPVPNPENMKSGNNSSWESQSESSSSHEIGPHTPTTGGGPSQLEGVKERRAALQLAPNNSDANSNNVPIIQSPSPILKDNGSISTLASDEIMNRNGNPFGSMKEQNHNVNVYKLLKVNEEKRVTLTQKVPNDLQNIDIPPPPEPPTMDIKNRNIRKRPLQKPQLPVQPKYNRNVSRNVSRDISRNVSINMSMASSHSVPAHDNKEQEEEEEEGPIGTGQYNEKQRMRDEDENTVICNIDNDDDDDDVLSEEYDGNIEDIIHDKFAAGSFKMDALSMLALREPSSTNLSRQSTGKHSQFAVPPPPPHQSNIQF